jgi:hypothetical protein
MGEAPSEAQVRLAGALGLLDRGGAEPLGIPGLATLPRRFGRAQDLLPARGLCGDRGWSEEQQGEPEGPRHRAEGKDGRRFSRIACIPSRTSSPMKVSISSASDWSKMGPACLSQLLSARLVKRMAG